MTDARRSTRGVFALWLFVLPLSVWLVTSVLTFYGGAYFVGVMTVLPQQFAEHGRVYLLGVLAFGAMILYLAQFAVLTICSLQANATPPPTHKQTPIETVWWNEPVWEARSRLRAQAGAALVVGDTLVVLSLLISYFRRCVPQIVARTSDALPDQRITCLLPGSEDMTLLTPPFLAFIAVATAIPALITAITIIQVWSADPETGPWTDRLPAFGVALLGPAVLVFLAF